MTSGPVPSSAVETESRLRAIEALVRDEVGTVHDGRLSQQSLDGQYAPVESVWLKPGEFNTVTGGGSPTLGSIGTAAWPAWLMDASAVEMVAAIVEGESFPTGWTSYNVDVYWTTASGSGDVVWRYDTTKVLDTESLNDLDAVGSSVIITAPAANVLKVTRVASGIAVPSSGELAMVRLLRNGSSGSDSLAADAAVLGLRLGKA